jgi:hypothetical protein
MIEQAQVKSLEKSNIHLQYTIKKYSIKNFTLPDPAGRRLVGVIPRGVF